MIGALASLVLVGGAALIVGQALVALCGGAGPGAPASPSWMAPPLGLAALLVVAGTSIRLPGHALTASLALATTTLAAALVMRGRVGALGPAAALAAPVALICALAAALPFAVAGEVGVLGAGLVNDDMASHLIIADYIADPAGPVPSFIEGGYPIGPHALVAAVAESTGAGLVEVFAGLTLALAALLGLLALGLLDGLPRGRRALGACLVALSYLGIAYLAQGAFKEPILSVLLLATAGSLEGLLGGSRTAIADPPPSAAHPILRALPLGVLVAAVVLTYSLPGLLWVAAVGAAVIAARLALVRPRPRLPAGWLRTVAPYALGVLAVLVVATAQEWGRLADFSRISALNPDRFGSQLGNLRGSLSPLEALGIWPAGDFRTTAAASGLPAPAFYLGAAVALAAFVAGVAGALRARRPWPVAAALAALALWGLLALIGSPYIAAKALAIAAPLVMVVAVSGTLGSTRPVLIALGAALAAGAALSTFLVLRAAPVGPDSHADQLAEIRSEVEGRKVLFLGRDDFIGWELRGSGEISGVVTNFYDVTDLRPRFKKGKGGGEKFDFDVLFPRQLDRFPYVLATAGGPLSQVPPSFEVATRSDDYVLYRRNGPTGSRRTLDEGTRIGRELDCSDPQSRAIAGGPGFAVIWDPVPIVGGADRWAPSDELGDGSPASQRITLAAPGRWLISLAYDSRRPLHVTAPALGLDTEVAANLDFRGETPTFPVGVVDVGASTTADVTVETTQPNLLARVLGAPNEAHLRELTATPLASNAVRRVPLSEACGKYVDWYRPG